MDKITYFSGQPITSYNKEELIQIVTYLGQMLQSERNRAERSYDMISSLAKYHEGRDAC